MLLLVGDSSEHAREVRLRLSESIELPETAVRVDEAELVELMEVAGCFLTDNFLFLTAKMDILTGYLISSFVRSKVCLVSGAIISTDNKKGFVVDTNRYGCTAVGYYGILMILDY